MRVLIVSASYAPEETGIGPYSGELAAGLAGRGHTIDVLTLPPHFPAWEVASSERVHRRRSVRLEAAVRVHRLSSYVPPRVDAWRRIRYELAFGTAVAQAFRSLERPDVVIVVSPPLLAAPAGLYLARRWRAPSIMHLHDLVPGIARQSGAVTNPVVLGLATGVERHVYAEADAIAVISSAFARRVAALGHGHKCVVLPNWLRAIDREPGQRQQAIRDEFGVAAHHFAAVYSGSMGRKQGLEILLDAGANAGPCLRLIAIGAGPALQTLADGVARGDTPMLTLHPLQPRQRLPHVLASFDAALLVQRTGVGETALPSKLITYMAAALPVVASVDRHSEAGRVVATVGCGIVTAAGDSQALLEGLHQLRADPVAAAAMGARGRAYALAELGYDDSIRRWEGLLADVAVGVSRRGTVSRLDRGPQ
jgi:colanic acid biosynthesis glycosyl transferase WcaI